MVCRAFNGEYLTGVPYLDNTKSEARLTKSKTCQERSIKVNKIHYMRKLKDDLAGAGRPVPRIQLKGHWLQQAGFEINVRVINGCLALTTQ